MPRRTGCAKSPSPPPCLLPLDYIPLPNHTSLQCPPFIRPSLKTQSFPAPLGLYFWRLPCPINSYEINLYAFHLLICLCDRSISPEPSGYWEKIFHLLQVATFSSLSSSQCPSCYRIRSTDFIKCLLSCPRTCAQGSGPGCTFCLHRLGTC
jgi:hypothetical protein